MSLTSAQKSAVEARGNVLVVAGAGTGKTKTLVDRCLSLLLDEQPRVNIDEILLVTFTEAAAAEMRKRIRTRLEETSRGPQRQACLEQLALMDSAHIGTLHSFCFKLVRQHFYELELDPQVSVMRQEEAGLLASDTLDRLLRGLYSRSGDLEGRVQALVRMYGGGSDELVRKAILRLHNYMQTLGDPNAWLSAQREMFNQADPTHWRLWLREAMPSWRDEWREFLEALPKTNRVAQDCLGVLGRISEACDSCELATVCQDLNQVWASCEKGKKGAWLDPLEKFQEEIAFLHSLVQTGSGPEPLAQDWEWTREPLLTLLEVTSEFSRRFADEKRELGAVDFHDLEQHTLRLLWNPEDKKPSAIAMELRQRLKYIFVDEYQDINAAQDKIIEAVSREGAEANRFLVGDAKQSIYRFRLASPGIFRDYMRTWKGDVGTTIPLVENFRSRESLLELTNSIFRCIMPAALGGIDYESQALRFGAPSIRKPLATSSNAGPVAELHLRVKGEEQSEESLDASDPSRGEMQEAEKEARIIGMRLLELYRSKSPVWDDETKAFRPAQWMDMAILLRAPSRKAESYAKAFDRLGIPLQVAKRGFYDSIEISDILSLLQVLDNPLQDVPLIAVLRSPFANLTLPEIAEVRLAAKKVRFWNALVSWHRSQKAKPSADGNAALVKAELLLERFARWRKLARQTSLSSCLETILAETCYREWLLVQPRGPQRHGNVQRFIALAREFDQFQRRGLLRFLAYVDAQKKSDAEPEVAATGDCAAVRLMSIHQSKGLEFPIVALPDLAKPFNQMDLKSDLFLSEQYGLCSQVRPPHTRRKYPSLPLWLARRAERRELLGEELRLLYVAMTRARDRLILSASVRPKSLASFQEAATGSRIPSLLAARSYADWLAVWAGHMCPLGMDASGENEQLAWWIWDHTSEAAIPEAMNLNDSSSDSLAASAAGLVKRLDWRYAHSSATLEPAKSSASMLRRRSRSDDEPPPIHWTGRLLPTSELTGVDRGSAHHIFLQHMSLERPGDPLFLRDQSRGLLSAGMLTAEQARALDLEGIAAFWRTTTGQAILEHRDKVQRELAFTARFGVRDLAVLTELDAKPELDCEFVILQGVADLAVILPAEIWIVDFKTDQLDPGEVAARASDYLPQVRIYAAALSRIYGRPTTRSELFFISARRTVVVN